ncbi:hypothetical protein K439DRAFT_1611504 [Ramaria rubella]|nr:hypothetical protein K439DRAFT_1611504 [Ramaria rubella]
MPRGTPYSSPSLEKYRLELSNHHQLRHRRRSLWKWMLVFLAPVLVLSSLVGFYTSSTYVSLSRASQHISKATLSQASDLDMLDDHSQVQTALQVVRVPSSPPRVDRSILDKLRSLDTDECLTDLSLSTEYAWPPRVTRLPVEPKAPGRPTRVSLLRDPTLDVELCNTSPCRLLLPTFIGEQESKARRHLLQLSHLARALNRTLVLPNVGRSRMGSCAKWDFNFYYETQTGDVNFHEQVTFSAFRRWVALRAARPTAQVVEVLSAPRASENGAGLAIFKSSDLTGLENAQVAISSSKDTSKMSHNHCLQGRAPNLSFGDFSPVYISPYTFIRHALSRRKDDMASFGRGIIAALSSSLIAAKSSRNPERVGPFGLIEPDVLLLSWEIRHEVFPLALESVLPYAARWKKVAKSLSDRLQPFVAVHWRMERVPTSSLLRCVPLLISSITSLLVRHAVVGKTVSVYLATDYPTEGPDNPHSGTFRVDEEHHAVMRLFEESFRDHRSLKRVKLTNVMAELKQGGLLLEDISSNDIDPGLTGIIDKMVSSASTLFISGGPMCGKIR